MDALLAYLPQDRRAALAAGTPLPDRCTGTALFADIVGFTPLTEALTLALGPRRGVEALTDQVNAVYEALIAAVDHYEGTVIGFAGDAITCWFDAAQGPAAPRATACARAQQAAMATFAARPHPAGAHPLRLALKVAVATGPARRFLVGDPAHQVLDVLTGATLLRLAAAEHLATSGEVLVDAPTHAALGAAGPGLSRDVRHDPATGAPFFVLDPVTGDERSVRGDGESGKNTHSPSGPPLTPDHPSLGPDVLRPWLHPRVYARLVGGQGEFLTELRPAVALFLRFAGLDYDTDPAAGNKLDAYIRWVQSVVARYAGTLLDLTVGDKGQYLYAAWGAPLAHEDDARRAVAATQELRAPPAALAFSAPVQIGLSQGVMRAGAVGSPTRRTYAVLGDEVNLTARLMTAARPGQVLASARVYQATPDFPWEPLPPLRVKGKPVPVPVAALYTGRTGETLRLAEPRQPAALVGRAAELAQVQAHLDRARQGQGQVIGLVGEAGIGKSRLLLEIGRAAQAAGWAVYGGAAQSYGTNTPYLAWRGIMHAFFHLAADAPPAQQQAQVVRAGAALDPALRDRLPLLGLVLDLPWPDTTVTAGMDEKLRKESREALLIALLRARTVGQGTSPGIPLLLVLEDAHWLDPLSHDLLEAVGRAIYNLPVALLAAYRPPEIARLAAPRLAALPHFTELALGDLAAAAELVTARLARLLPAETTVPPATVALLVARGQGNPFYLEELVNYLVEQEVDLTDPARLAEVEWPASLHSLVLSRLDQLTELQQLTLRVASIVGRRFAADWLPGYYPALAAATVRAALQDTTRAELTALETPEPEVTYLFRHILTQEIAYASLGATTRAGLHAAVGAWLERAGSTDLDLLAYHYGRSANPAKRQEYLERAAAAAAAAYNNAAAVDYYEQLLAALAAAAPPRGAVLQALGDVLERMGAWEEAATRYQAAHAAAVAAGDGPRQAAAAVGLGVVRRSQGAYGEAITWLAAAQVASAAAGDGQGTARALVELGGVALLQGHYEQARARLEAAQAAIPAAGDRATRARALNYLGTMAFLQGEYTHARAAYGSSQALRHELGDHRGVAATLTNLGNVAFSQGEYVQARESFAAGLALYEELGDRLGIAVGRANLGTVAYRQGDYAEARAQGAASLALRRELGDRVGVAITLSNLGDAITAQGEYAEARQLYTESVALAREVGARAIGAEVLTRLGTVAALQGDHAAAQAWYTESLALSAELGNPGLVAYNGTYLALLELAAGDRARAQAHLAESLARVAVLGAGEEGRNTLVGVAALLAPAEVAAHLLGVVAGRLAAQHAVLEPLLRPVYTAATESTRAALGTAAYTTALAAGQELEWTAAVAQAQAALEAATGAASPGTIP